ncbi:MAG: radical SAM protein [Nanoarchaeota archaeon]|nr:radical SAM protein [Nanoarchaeota archaeon]
MCRVTFEFKGDRDFSKKHSIVSKTPIWACIEFTKRCNFNCIYCFAGEKTEGKNELTIEEYKTYFNKLKQLGFKQISLLGGEPLLREDFFEIARYAAEIGFVVHICSNGSLITKDNARKIKEAGITQVQMNLDHILPSEHDRIRGFNGSYALLLKAIENLKEVGVPIIIATIAMKCNRTVIPEIFEFARKNADSYRIWDMLPAGTAINNQNEILSFNEYKNLNEELIKLSKDDNIMIRTADPLISLLDSSIKHGACPAGEKMMYTSALGDIHYCSMDSKIFGNMRKQPIENILNSEEFTSNILLKTCKKPDCKLITQCRGGCYLRQRDGVDQKCWIGKSG